MLHVNHLLKLIQSDVMVNKVATTLRIIPYLKHGSQCVSDLQLKCHIIPRHLKLAFWVCDQGILIHAGLQLQCPLCE